jgi:hypothetical protein
MLWATCLNLQQEQQKNHFVRKKTARKEPFSEKKIVTNA